MNSYRAFDLTIASEIDLAPLPRYPGPADVNVRRRAVERPANPLRQGLTFALTRASVVFSWPGVGRLEVEENEISIDAAPGVDDAALVPLLAGPAFAVVLHRRGQLLLHASAVSVDGGGVAFLGASGVGKSTLAGAMYARGCPLICDDACVADTRSGSTSLVPAFPQLKLCDALPPALDECLGPAAAIRRGSTKSWRAAGAGFSARPVPLDRVYVLSRSKRHGFTRLNTKAAFFEALRHSYLARVAPWLSPERHLLGVVQLVRAVPFYRVELRPFYGELDVVCSRIERHSCP